MINEKELRPGNLYATIRNHEIVVKGIDTVNKFVLIEPANVDFDISSRSENSIIFEDLNPIELTENRISELGLLEESMPLGILSDNGAKFIWDEKINHVVLTDGAKGTIGLAIKHLHQFQNIYFILTGKELPLNI
ncbi:MAG: hypothetical protein WKF89_18680 [Chitinophagaceae bacterium]